MSSLLRSAAVFSLVSLVLAISMPGCSQQGEGEHCDQLKNGDADCNSGLVCVGAMQLSDHSSDRCCPPSGTASSDPRCEKGNANSSGGSSNGGSGGAGGTGGKGGTAGSLSSGGEPSSAGMSSSAGAPPEASAGAAGGPEGGAPASTGGAGAGGA